jgi:hypothetical protein
MWQDDETAKGLSVSGAMVRETVSGAVVREKNMMHRLV